MPTLPIVPAEGAPVAAAPAATRAERFAALEAEHKKVMEEYHDLLRAAKTDEEAQAIAKANKAPDEAPFVARANALLAEDPKDETALKAIGWLFQNSHTPGEKARLCALVEQYHFESAEVAGLLRYLGGAGDPGVHLVERLSEKSPHEAVRGRALYQRASLALEDRRIASDLRAMPSDEEKKVSAESLGQERYQRLTQLDLAQAEATTLALLQRVEKEYGTVKLRAGTPTETTLAAEAEVNIFEIQNLSVGKVAPEIEGEDTSGVAFKLSDYRGKVVMLDFWGFW